MRRSLCLLLSSALVLLIACAAEGPVHDKYTFDSLLGGGTVEIDRPGGPAFCTIKTANGGCLWFTTTQDPTKCIGDCVTVPAGGGVYQAPKGANVWHFDEDCSQCPCEPEAAPKGDPPVKPQAASRILSGTLITSTRDRSGYTFASSCTSPWQDLGCFERLRDRQPALNAADALQYVSLDGKDGLRNWTLSVRDDNQAITDVHVLVNGSERGHTRYESGSWGFGSVTTIELGVRELRPLIGGQLVLEVHWLQGGVPRETTYEALLK